MSTLTYFMQPDFGVGDTADCFFGRVTWRDPDHLEKSEYDDDNNTKIYRIQSGTDDGTTIVCQWPHIL